MINHGDCYVVHTVLKANILAPQEDGTDIIACDSCDVWQHLECQKLPPGGEDDEFICDLCRRYRKSAEGPVGPDGLPPSPQIIKLRVGPPSPEKARTPFDSPAKVQSPMESAAALSAIVSGPPFMDIMDQATERGSSLSPALLG
jgi:hypothetical protein